MSNFTHTIRGLAVDNGNGGRKFQAHDPEAFRRWLLRFNPGDEIILGAKRWRAKHSPEQRGYLHGVVIPMILEEMGFEDSKENHDQMYIKLKEKFGQAEVRVGRNDEEMIFARSMADSDTVEMGQLIDGSIRWAGSFLGITIPPPNRVMLEGAGI